MVIKRIKAVSWCIILICFISILFSRNSIKASAAELPFSEGDLTVLAKTLYGEANSVKSKAEKSMVVWTVLNRYDAGGFGKTITEICTKPGQFTGYSAGHPVTEDNLALVKDVTSRWLLEQNGVENSERTLPREYVFFHGDSNPSKGEWHNQFYHYDKNRKKIYYDYKNPIANPYG